MQRLIRHAIPAVLVVAGCLAGAAADVGADVVADGPGLSATEADSTVSVTTGGRPVLRYRHGDVPRKPYVQKLFTPAGVQILRDAPHDHLHHHALMFAVVVDGVDFWGERPDRGKQVGGPLKMAPAAAQNGLARLSIEQKLRWMPPTGGEPLVVEDRTIEVYSGEGLDATLLTWQSTLEPGAGRGGVTLTGTHYDGLGMRFVESMDEPGRFLYAAGEPGPIVRGTERLTPAAWAAYTAKAQGRAVTVAVFDGPDNPRHPAGMFTMSQPFAYLSATPNVWKEPLELKAGRPLVLRYGVALWDGEVDAEAIGRLYGRWLRLQEP